jgi:hypothetical protein
VIQLVLELDGLVGCQWSGGHATPFVLCLFQPHANVIAYHGFFHHQIFKFSTPSLILHNFAQEFFAAVPDYLMPYLLG